MKRPLLLLILLCLCSVTSLFAQEANQKLRELFLDGEYFFLSEDYDEALYSYNTLYKRGYADNGNINYRIGVCYLNIPGEKSKAIPFLEKAVENMTGKYNEGSFKETKAPYEAQFFLGNGYRIMNDLDKAVAAYEKYKTLIDPKNVVGSKIANKEIEACAAAKEMMKRPLVVKKVTLGRPVNTTSRDYFPAVSGDETALVYNSSQKFYQAIMFSRKINKKWSNPINITPELESDGNQFVSSLSFDGRELYLRLEDKFEGTIMVSKYENGKWSKSKPLNKNINTKYFEGNASVSSDGLTLYFSSNRPGGSGALDLYKSVRNKLGGEWGPAVNLGAFINTEYNEDAPFITEDNKRLYFVSQGHRTMGGYDIFYCDLKDDGSWSEPVNLGYPINTTDDELFYCPIRKGQSAYYAGYIKEGYGSQDLFRLDIIPYEEVAIVDKTKELTPSLVEEQNSNGLKESVVAAQDTMKTKEKEVSEGAVNKLTESKSVAEKEIDQSISRSLFFDFNSAVLGSNEKMMLNHLSIIMDNSPAMRIELIGTADAKGNDAYNLSLSERRAKAAKDYMISKGIKAIRISIKGVGKSNFIALNSNPDGTDNPEGRRYNRRVDIQVKEENAKAVKIQEVNLPDNLKIK